MTNRLFNFIEIDISDLRRYPTIIQNIYARKINGAIIHHAFSVETVETMLERLPRIDPPLCQTMYPWGRVYGRVLVSPNTDLPQYFEDAQKFRSSCKILFGEGQDFETRIEEILNQVAGGLSAAIPEYADHCTYAPATIRVLEPGQGLRLHCGNQFLHRLPKLHHLSTISDLKNQLSYFVMLSTAEAGGKLLVYDIEWAETLNGIVEGGQSIDEVIDTYDNLSLNLKAGDLLLFDGGRIWHQVTPVIGQQNRITIGGFISYSQDHQQIYYWS